MSETQTTQVEKLEKLREAWLPAVEFLFGAPAIEVQFDGFEVSDDIAKPKAIFNHPEQPFRYTLQMPARSFTNDVMLLADLMQEMTRGLYPTGYEQHSTTALAEGAAIYGAVAALKQVFGEESVDSYLNALREQAFAYYDAFSYVSVLLTEDPQGIKKLREIKPFLYQVERVDFDAAGIDIDRKIKDILTMTFRL